MNSLPAYNIWYSVTISFVMSRLTHNSLFMTEYCIYLIVTTENAVISLTQGFLLIFDKQRGPGIVVVCEPEPDQTFLVVERFLMSSRF